MASVSKCKYYNDEKERHGGASAQAPLCISSPTTAQMLLFPNLLLIIRLFTILIAVPTDANSSRLILLIQPLLKGLKVF